MRLSRARSSKALISLVPMVDVMLILLVFFMVTSTYLNLDTIAISNGPDTAASGPATTGNESPLLVRLAADGVPYIRGSAQTPEGLATLIQEKLNENPLAFVIVLPSGAASTQDLVSVMETATLAGASRLRLVRLDARE